MDVCDHILHLLFASRCISSMYQFFYYEQFSIALYYQDNFLHPTPFLPSIFPCIILCSSSYFVLRYVPDILFSSFLSKSISPDLIAFYKSRKTIRCPVRKYKYIHGICKYIHIYIYIYIYIYI